MSTIYDSSIQAVDVGALALVPVPPPWYATVLAPLVDRQGLEGEHTRVLARAVGDYLP